MRPREGESEKTKYIKELFCHEDAPLQFATEEAKKIHPNMHISDYEGKILQVLLRAIDAKRVIEFGAFTGYSGVWMTRVLGENGHFVTMESNPKHADITRETFRRAGLEKNTTVLEGLAFDNLSKASELGPFDAVFIDADKGGYIDYLKWAEENIRKGGLIIGDNTFLWGEVYKNPRPKDSNEKSWNSMRAFNERLADKSKYTSIILPTIEGMTVAIKEF